MNEIYSDAAELLLSCVSDCNIHYDVLLINTSICLLQIYVCLSTSVPILKWLVDERRVCTVRLSCLSVLCACVQ